MKLHAEIKTGHHGRSHRIERMRHYHRSRQRHGQSGKQSLSESGESGVSEWGLELTDTDSKLIADLHVCPCLLEQTATRRGGVDGEIVGDETERTARETEHSVWNRETELCTWSWL